MPKSKVSTIWPVLALIISIVLVASMALEFVSVTFLGHTTGYSGFTVAGGFTWASAYAAAYLIMVGGIIALVFAVLTLVPSMRPKVRIMGIVILLGAVISLIGGALTYSHLNPIFTNSIIPGSAGIGLWIALIFAVVEIIVSIPIILEK